MGELMDEPTASGQSKEMLKNRVPFWKEVDRCRVKRADRLTQTGEVFVFAQSSRGVS